MSFVTLPCAEKIVEQMKNNVCKIRIKDVQGIGFFCKIPYPDMNNMLPVLITNNHVINEELLNQKDADITISTQGDVNIKEMKLDHRIKYTNKEYDVTIIEVKEEDNINSFLELDDTLLEDVLNDKNKNLSYIEESIYLIGYIKGTLVESSGTLQNISEERKYLLIHNCRTGAGAGGSPLLNVRNNKVIGIHHSTDFHSHNKRRGTFLNYPIKELIKLKK